VDKTIINSEDKSNEAIKKLLSDLHQYNDQVVFKALCLYYNDELVEDINNIPDAVFKRLDNAWDEYLANDYIKLISEPILDALNNVDIDILSDYIYEAIDELDNYDLAYSLRKNLGLSGKDKIENINEMLVNGQVDELLSFFSDIKDNEQLKYLIEISTFNSDTYNNIVEDIIPELENLKKQEKDYDLGN